LSHDVQPRIGAHSDHQSTLQVFGRHAGLEGRERDAPEHAKQTPPGVITGIVVLLGHRYTVADVRRWRESDTA
jgi:hypothetical protein